MGQDEDARLATAGLVAYIQGFLRRIGASRGILFGSRARGDWISSSDVDLVVVSEGFADLSFPRRLVLLQEKWDSPYFLEGLPYTEEELRRLCMTRGVVKHALDTGIEILPLAEPEAATRDATPGEDAPGEAMQE